MLTAAIFALLAVSAHAQFDDDFVCPDEFEGYYPHDLSCDRYWECKDGVATLETCGNGLAFDDLDPTYTTKNCDYVYNVDCGNRTDLEPPISATNCPRLYGTFADPDDCTGFYNCRDGLANRFSCAPGLAFDPKTRVCKWADQVKACKAQKAEEEEEVFQCPDNVPVGIFSKHAHPADCRQYFVCISGIPREYGCPLGTVFKIGGDEFDGKCADPEDVPECANYYGDLDFDKQELVKAGVDPEAVGAKVNPARSRVSRPRPVVFDVEEEEDDFILPAPIKPAPKPVTSSDSFRNRVRTRPSRPIRPAVIPETTTTTTTATTTTTTSTTPAPRPPPTRPARPVPTPTEAPREVPAIPLNTLNSNPAPVAPVVTAAPSLVPQAVPVVTAKPSGLGQPAKVKAGEDYYYYYYYYDDEYPDEAAPANAATSK